MRRFAQDTSVPISRSRGEIEDLLRTWGCTKLGWSDEYDEGRATLQFVWVRESTQYIARFAVQLPRRDAFIAEWKRKNGSWSVPAESTIEKALAQGGRSAFRVLLLWIKASLNAVEHGIVSAESVFLPWIVTPDGRTVAEALVPRMADLLTTPAERLLPAPGRKP